MPGLRRFGRLHYTGAHTQNKGDSCPMSIPQPILDISTGFARFMVQPPHFEPGHNFTNEIGNIDAENDWEAMLAFLNEYRYSEKTFRSYATELERLCLWLIHVHKVPLSGLKRTDLAAYYEFVASPPPAWCGPSAKKFRKDGTVNPAWRPFKLEPDGTAGLAPGSVQRLQKILRSMFTYFVDEGFLLGNPATARRTKGQRSGKASRIVERFLQPHEAAFVEQLLQQEIIRAQQSGNKERYFRSLRRHYIYELFLHTGLRISEPVKYTMGDIQVRGTGEKKTLSLEISGKGNIDGETRTVVLGEAFINILKTYRIALNAAIDDKRWTALDPLPAFNEPTPLIPDMSGLRAIGERQLSSIFGEIREICLEALDGLLQKSQDPEQTNDLKRMRSTLAVFTCHWMRHTHATYFLALSGDLRATQDRLGHADLSTTQIYVHVLDKSREQAANKFDPSKMSDLI